MVVTPPSSSRLLFAVALGIAAAGVDVQA